MCKLQRSEKDETVNLPNSSVLNFGKRILQKIRNCMPGEASASVDRLGQLFHCNRPFKGWKWRHKSTTIIIKKQEQPFIKMILPHEVTVRGPNKRRVFERPQKNLSQIQHWERISGQPSELSITIIHNDHIPTTT